MDDLIIKEKLKKDLVDYIKTKFKTFGKKQSLADFIKSGFEKVGGNYEVATKRFAEMVKVANDPKAFGLDLNLFRVLEADNDFFSENKIKFKPINREDVNACFYEKEDKNGLSNHRGVTIFDYDDDATCMYFGRRLKDGAKHASNAAFYFEKDFVLFVQNDRMQYDEIPLAGTGNYVCFGFDKNNDINKISYRKMSMPRLGIWDDEYSCEYQKQGDSYSLLKKINLTKGEEELLIDNEMLQLTDGESMDCE